MTLEQDTRRVRTTSLGWMIQRLSRRLERAMAERLAALGLSLPQFAVMMTVLETPGLTQAQIGDRFEMPAYSISRAIDQLEEAGLVERRPHPASRRAHTIYPTARGQALGADLFAVVGAVNDQLAAPLSARERDRFSRLLTKLL